jgi:hypothetical protein
MGLRHGTNNYVELMFLELLFLFVGEKYVKYIQIFGDSLNVINWAQKTQRCHNIFKFPFLEEIQIILDAFDSFYVWHVCKECNLDINSLSKEGIQMGYVQWVI